MSGWDQKAAWLAALPAGLGPNGARVALALADTAAPDGTLAPGERQLAVAAECSRSTVWTYLRLLVQAGLMTEIGVRVPGHPACYRLVVPEAGR
jgi:hypothetical protein